MFALVELLIRVSKGLAFVGLMPTQAPAILLFRINLIWAGDTGNWCEVQAQPFQKVQNRKTKEQQHTPKDPHYRRP